MQQIRIIQGTYGHRPDGTHRIRPVMAGDMVSVPDAEAQRLVGIGVAEIVPQVVAPACEGVATLQEGTSNGEPCIGMDAKMILGEANAEGGAASTLDPEQLRSMTNAKLRELAEALGIHTAKLKNKAELIHAIISVPAIPGSGEAIVGDGEEPPGLCVEAPVI